MDVKQSLDQLLLPHAVPAGDAMSLGQRSEFLAGIRLEFLDRHLILRRDTSMDASTSAGRQRSPGRKEKRQPLSEQELPSSFRDARPVCRPWSSSSRAATARVGGSIVAAAAYMAGDRPRDGMVSRVRRRPCPQGLASRSNAILVWHVDVPHARRNDIRRARTVVPALGGIFKRRAVEFLGPAAVVSHKSLSHNKIRSRTICDSVTHAFCSSRF